MPAFNKTDGGNSLSIVGQAIDAGEDSRVRILQEHLSTLSPDKQGLVTSIAKCVWLYDTVRASLGVFNGSTANELVDFLINELNGITVYLLDFKDVWHIEQSALRIIFGALKSPELKSKKIQFSGLRSREAKFLRSHGINISRRSNYIDIVKHGAHSTHEVAIT